MVRFNALIFSGVGGGWTFLDTNATVLGDMTIATGTVVLPMSTLSLGGSFSNTGIFTSGTSTVTLTATVTGKSITPGASPFYNLTLNSSSGGWTITANATTTNNFSLTNASSFTLSPNTTLAVGGIFTNSVGGAATTFATSTLSLYSGTGYSLNTKSAGGDVYGTLSIAASTNIRMWNSSAATTTVNSTGSLYSQNHAGVSGALNIYGAFSSSGLEYWSYATDFDGTALAGSSRQVSVNVASSSSITMSGTFAILGTTTASTTIQNQGSGAYSLAVTGGSLNAQYYQIRNTDANGLNISGTPSVVSLANGDYQLAQSGGYMMSVNASVINQNPLLQILQVRFATSSGVTSGSNVREVGTPTSYWWFKQHYGNFAGEAYNSDPGGNPGYIRWDDSGYSITVAGHVYADHGVRQSGLSASI